LRVACAWIQLSSCQHQVSHIILRAAAETSRIVLPKQFENTSEK